MTGAGGMLGRDVMRVAPDATGVTHAELDITDAAAVARLIADVRPDAIINCAAYTNVDGAEADEDAARAVNGSDALARAAGEAVLVYPSTDYVFDGEKREPYVESDPVGPRSASGRSKLAGERATATARNHVIVRTSWLFGVGGKNFVDTMLGLDGELKVVDDQVGCPTYTGHLAQALVALAAGDLRGIVHVAGGGTCSWYEFAREIFRQAGKDVDLSPCTTADFPRPAPRPAYSVLGSEREHPITLPQWQDGVRAHLAALQEVQSR